MSEAEPTDREAIERNVRQVVGIAALRRIRRIVDQYQAEEAGERRLVPWVLWLGAALAVVGGLYFYFHLSH